MPTDTTAKRVFWFDDHKTPNVADVLAQAADVVVHRLAFDAPAAENWAVMARCHAYCITSSDSRHMMAQWNAEQLVQIFQGHYPPRLVNPEAWETFAQRFAQIFGFWPTR